MPIKLSGRPATVDAALKSALSYTYFYIFIDLGVLGKSNRHAMPIIFSDSLMHPFRAL